MKYFSKILIPRIFLMALIVFESASASQNEVLDRASNILSQEVQSSNPGLFKELLSFSKKNEKVALYISKLQDQKKEVMSFNVLPDLLWYAAKDVEFDIERLKKHYPVLFKEAGGIAIVDEKSETPKLVVHALPPTIPLTMIFEKKGEMEYVDCKGPDYFPKKYEMKEINGKKFLITSILDRTLPGDTNRIEVLDYFLIENQTITHAKTENKSRPMQDKFKKLKPEKLDLK